MESGECSCNIWNHTFFFSFWREISPRHIFHEIHHSFWSFNQKCEKVSLFCRSHSATTVSCTQSGDEPIRKSACSFLTPRVHTLPSIPCFPQSCWKRRQTRPLYERRGAGERGPIAVVLACYRFLTQCHKLEPRHFGSILFYLILFI